VHSYSKYVGATGWRLGVVAVNRDNVLDRMLADLPEADKVALDHRYSALTLHTRKLRFIDRMVADSRNVALNHTAGLSLPQQVMMLLFSAYCLLDEEDHYKHATQALIRRRLDRLFDGVDVDVFDDPNRVGYYVELDFLNYTTLHYGPEFAAFLQENYEPTDLLFRLAEQTGIVLLNGGGFDGPQWSVRASLANLRDEQYEQIGKSLAAIGRQYVDEWRKSRE
jgi:aspartate 4-decarboxylase